MEAMENSHEICQWIEFNCNRNQFNRNQFHEKSHADRIGMNVNSASALNLILQLIKRTGVVVGAHRKRRNDE